MALEPENTENSTEKQAVDRYIFRCEPDDFILAGRAIKAALKKGIGPHGGVCEFENGAIFDIIRNKNSITVRSNALPNPPETEG